MSRPLDSTGLKRLHRQWRRRTERRVALALDSVSGPFNVGAIVRTAAALRVETVWLMGDTPDLDGDKVAKTALGTDRYLHATRLDGPAALAAAAHDAGFGLVAIELTDDAVPLHDLALDADVCVVVGHEDRGVRADTLEVCDQVGFIPQLGRVGSLNVATAAAIALYEVRRHHFTTSS